MINKIFYFLLFCSIAGAGVLWWLINAVPQQGETTATSTAQSDLTVEDIVEDSIEDPLNPPPVEAESAEEVESGNEADEAQEVAESSSSSEVSAPATSETISADPSILSITSDPAGVNVFVNGRQSGITPFETTLTANEQTLRFELEGYVPVERKAPAEEVPEGAFMSWRISMVKQELPSREKDEVAEVADYFPSGMVGPVFIQVKSMEQKVHGRAAVLDELKLMRGQLSNDKVVACSVELANRGMWYRILIGPFSSKSEARSSLPFVKKSIGVDDVFVTGAQKCL